jgi:hypothetical protein
MLSAVPSPPQLLAAMLQAIEMPPRLLGVILLQTAMLLLLLLLSSSAVDAVRPYTAAAVDGLQTRSTDFYFAVHGAP